MTDQELINICENFTKNARTSTTKLDLLTIAFAAQAFYKHDWDRPLYDSGNWMSELDKKIQYISDSNERNLMKGNDLSSFKDDIVDALSSLCAHFTYNFRDTPKN
jgi:hypothetical protein